MRITVLLASAVIVGALIPATQVDVFGQTAQRPARPASAVRDLNTVLYDWANYMGMLKGPREVEAIATLELWGTGTIALNGLPCKMTQYRASINYQFPGMREDVTCMGSDGTLHHEIRVVSDKFAWNEAKRGFDATPAMDTVTDRLLQIWSSPQGAVKAARAGGANTKMLTEGGKTVLTFPVPGISGATMKATLSAMNQTERVETQIGNTVTISTYSDYGDLNDPNNRGDVFLPKRMVRMQGQIALLDLSVSKTDTTNPYVIMPVPDNMQKAAR